MKDRIHHGKEVDIRRLRAEEYQKGAQEAYGPCVCKSVKKSAAQPKANLNIEFGAFHYLSTRF